ncbi:MAG TPA: hypothetical protein VF796_13065 [Humisphaera sp.]
MKFELDEDDPAYGVLFVAGGDKSNWIGHLCRTDLRYHSRLLGRPTRLLLSVFWAGIGALRRSPTYYLTLDGAGVTLPPGAKVSGAWYAEAPTRSDRIAAWRSATRVVERMNGSGKLKRSIEHVMRHGCYAEEVDPADLEQAGGPLDWD